MRNHVALRLFCKITPEEVLPIFSLDFLWPTPKIINGSPPGSPFPLKNHFFKTFDRKVPASCQLLNIKLLKVADTSTTITITRWS